MAYVYLTLQLHAVAVSIIQNLFILCISLCFTIAFGILPSVNL